MKYNRRSFLKLTSMTSIGLIASDIISAPAYIPSPNIKQKKNKVTINYADATLEDGRIISIPFWRVDSGRDGPSLALVAAQHGNEVQGSEVARRFQQVCATQLVAGSVWLAPMANLLAVQSRRHSFNLGPEENNSINADKLHNMQRHWPGDPKGNDTARLAYALDQKMLRHCSHLVDMHCWNHFTAAEALCESEREESRAMGEVTTTRFISYRNLVIPQSGKMMISQMMLKRGAAVHVMELSGQFQILERQVKTGLSSMVNIAKMLGMINGEPELIKGKRAIRTSENTHHVKAPCKGLFVPALIENKDEFIAPEDYIEKGQQIGHIIREDDLAVIPLASPVSGYIRRLGACHWGLCDASLPAQHPYTEENEIVAMIVAT